jgi:hypothetical protein
MGPVRTSAFQDVTCPSLWYALRLGNALAEHVIPFHTTIGLVAARLLFAECATALLARPCTDGGACAVNHGDVLCIPHERGQTWEQGPLVLPVHDKYVFMHLCSFRAKWKGNTAVGCSSLSH